MQLGHTEGLAGEISKGAQVVTNDPQRPTFGLSLKASFKPENKPGATPGNSPALGGRLGPFMAAPTPQWIAAAISGIPAGTMFTLYNMESNPVRIKKVNVSNDFTVTLQTAEDGRRYTVMVVSKADLKPGKYIHTIQLTTDSKTTPEISIPIELTIISKVIATPVELVGPKIVAGADMSTVKLPVINLRKVRDGGLKVNAVSSSLPFLKVTFKVEVEGEYYTIQAVLDPSQTIKPGSYTGTIKIETNDAERPVVEVPVRISFP